jgi:hypothetical protein
MRVFARLTRLHRTSREAACKRDFCIRNGIFMQDFFLVAHIQKMVRINSASLRNPMMKRDICSRCAGVAPASAADCVPFIGNSPVLKVPRGYWNPTTARR